MKNNEEKKTRTGVPLCKRNRKNDMQTMSPTLEADEQYNVICPDCRKQGRGWSIRPFAQELTNEAGQPIVRSEPNGDVPARLDLETL